MRRLPLVALVVNVVALSVSPAHALEGEWRVQGGGGAAHSADTRDRALLFAGAAYGLADGLDLRAEALGVLGQGALALGLHAGALAKWEVTEWVPFAALGVGVRRQLQAGVWCAQILPAVGLDYLFNRRFSVVLEYRPALAPWDDPLLEHQGLLGFEGRWGW